VLGVPPVRYHALKRGLRRGPARLPRRRRRGHRVGGGAPPIAATIEPDPALHDAYQPRIAAFRALYRAPADVERRL
jgi:xylulokinase